MRRPGNLVRRDGDQGRLGLATRMPAAVGIVPFLRSKVGAMSGMTDRGAQSTPWSPRVPPDTGTLRGDLLRLGEQ